MSSHTLWFATRGSGVVSLLLLTAIVVLGVAGATRWRSTRWPRFVVAGLHRNLRLLALVFIAIHVITTVADGYAPISLLSAVLPFTSAVSAHLARSRRRRARPPARADRHEPLAARIGYRPWRALHWLAYASWPVALVHGLGTGTDARVAWMQIVTVACVACVVAAVLWRVASSERRTDPRNGHGGGARAPARDRRLVSRGPARHGWAARAGTPQSLLRTRLRRRPGRAATRAPALPVGAIRGTFNGRVQESGRTQTAACSSTSPVVRAAATRGALDPSPGRADRGRRRRDDGERGIAMGRRHSRTPTSARSSASRATGSCSRSTDSPAALDAHRPPARFGDGTATGTVHGNPTALQ